MRKLHNTCCGVWLAACVPSWGEIGTDFWQEKDVVNMCSMPEFNVKWRTTRGHSGESVLLWTPAKQYSCTLFNIQKSCLSSPAQTVQKCIAVSIIVQHTHSCMLKKTQSSMSSSSITDRCTVCQLCALYPVLDETQRSLVAVSVIQSPLNPGTCVLVGTRCNLQGF